MLKNVLAGIAATAATAVLVLGVAAPASAYPLDEPGVGNLSENAAAPGATITYAADTGLANESGTVNATPDVEFITANSLAITTNAEGRTSFSFRLPNAEPGTQVTLSVNIGNGAFTDTETITIAGAPADGASSGVNADGQSDDELAYTGWNGTTLLLLGGAAVLLGALLVAARVLRNRKAGASL